MARSRAESDSTGHSAWRSGCSTSQWRSTPVHRAREPRSPPVQLRRIETSSSSLSGAPSPLVTRVRACVTSSGPWDSRCSATRPRMMRSNHSATSRVRVSSPERVASWFASIHSMSSSSTSERQPSHVDCARTAYTEPISRTDQMGAPGTRDSTRESATFSTRGLRRTIASVEKKGSRSSRISRCSSPSRPLGTWRKRETWLEKVAASWATRTASAWERTRGRPRGSVVSAAARSASCGSSAAGTSAGAACWTGQRLGSVMRRFSQTSVTSS